MKKRKTTLWTDKEVETLLQMTAKEIGKKFYSALKSPSKTRGKKNTTAPMFDPKSILAKARKLK
jgi:hypothetical protein